MMLSTDLRSLREAISRRASAGDAPLKPKTIETILDNCIEQAVQLENTGRPVNTPRGMIPRGENVVLFQSRVKR